MNKDLLKIAAVALIAGLIGGFVAGLVDVGNQSSSVGGLTRLPNSDFSAATITSNGAFTSTGAATLSSTLSLGGLATLNAGQLKSYTNASSSVTTGTLKTSDVQGYDTVLLTPTGAAAAKTLTFFASSTASAWLPAAGDRQDTCFFNSTTTAGVDIIFAAGTGIDLEVASSSATALGSLKIGPSSMGCFTFVRQPSLDASFDISAGYTAFEDAD